MLGREICELDHSSQKVDNWSLSTVIFSNEIPFSNDEVIEGFPRSSHRAITTDWEGIKPPNIHVDDEIEIISVYSVTLSLNDKDETERGKKREENQKSKQNRELGQSAEVAGEHVEKQEKESEQNEKSPEEKSLDQSEEPEQDRQSEQNESSPEDKTLGQNEEPEQDERSERGTASEPMPSQPSPKSRSHIITGKLARQMLDESQDIVTVEDPSEMDNVILYVCDCSDRKAATHEVFQCNGSSRSREKQRN